MRCLRGNPEEPVIPLTIDGEYYIGRSRSCQIVIINTNVSRKHAKIVVEGSRISVIDLDSSNGTYVNGTKISSVELQSGDRIQIGEKSFRFIDGMDELSLCSDNRTLSMPPPDDKRHVIDELPPKAKKVFRFLLGSLSYQEIGKRMGIARNTVHGHVKKVYRLLGVKRRYDLIRKYSPRPKDKSKGKDKEKENSS